MACKYRCYFRYAPIDACSGYRYIPRHQQGERQIGAQFQFERVDATEREAVKTAFEALQTEDRYERGHSYSGGFGMADGIEFRDTPSFTDSDAAYEWLDDHARKWEAALAVRHVDESGKVLGYFVGAHCAC